MDRAFDVFLAAQPPLMLAAQAAQNAQHTGLAVNYASAALNMHRNPMMRHYTFHKLANMLAMDKTQDWFVDEDEDADDDCGDVE